MEHSHLASLCKMNKVVWGFGEDSTRLLDMMEGTSMSLNTNNPMGSYLEAPKKQDNAHANKPRMYPFKDTP